MDAQEKWSFFLSKRRTEFTNLRIMTGVIPGAHGLQYLTRQSELTAMKIPIHETPDAIGVATVAEIAIQYPGAASVFTRYDIDYCCGGRKLFSEVCRQAGLDAERILTEVCQASPASNEYVLRTESWSSPMLMDFIVQNHHVYVAKAVPEIIALLNRVCERHGAESPELLRISAIFNQLANELLAHMLREERVLFPMIKTLLKMNEADDPTEKAIQGPIAVMEDDHDLAGDLVRQIRTLTNHYTPPSFACPTFFRTYQELKTFDRDLTQHIHLENNVLFPRFKWPEQVF